VMPVVFQAQNNRQSTELPDLPVSKSHEPSWKSCSRYKPTTDVRCRVVVIASRISQKMHGVAHVKFPGRLD